MTKSIPNGSVAAGNPARVISTFEQFKEKVLLWTPEKKMPSNASYKEWVSAGLVEGFKPTRAPDTPCSLPTRHLIPDCVMPKQTKIAFHFTDLSSGGVEKMRLALSRQLLSLGYQVDLVLCRAKGEYLEQVPPGVAIVDLAATRTLKSVRPLAEYLRDQKPDVLVSSMGPPNIAAVIATKLSGSHTPLFVTQHNALTRQGQTGSLQQGMIPFLYRFALPLTSGVIAVSKGVADDMALATGFQRDRIRVIYNPAYPADLDTKLSERVDSSFFDRGIPTIVAVGRLIYQKGFDTLISALALMNKQHPVQLAIVGVGPLKAALEAQAESLGIADRVEFMGFQRNPLKYMKNASVVVMSSRFEGFGNVLVEAMACGTPVVSTNCPSGPSEILADGEYGRLVAVDDAQALADATVATIQNPLDGQRLRLRAEEFSVGAITQQYLDLILGDAR